MGNVMYGVKRPDGLCARDRKTTRYSRGSTLEHSVNSGNADRGGIEIPFIDTRVAWQATRISLGMDLGHERPAISKISHSKSEGSLGTMGCDTGSSSFIEVIKC